MPSRTHTIDATGKIAGRLATEVAMLLMGKKSADYRPNLVSSDTVTVTNLLKVQFSGQKMEKKQYHRFTGYPTGIHTKKLSDMWEKDPEDSFRNIVSGMLPKNRLRPLMLKKLTIQL